MVFRNEVCSNFTEMSSLTLLSIQEYWKIERVELGGNSSGSCQIGDCSTGGIESAIAYYRRD